MRPSAREFAEFNGLLCSVVEKGLPLPPAVDLMAGVVRHRGLGNALRGVARALADGAALPDALGLFPDVFPPDYCGLIRAGLESGRLAEVLRTAQTQHALVARVRSKMSRLGLYLFSAALMGEAVLALSWFVGGYMVEFNKQIMGPLEFKDKPLWLALVDTITASGGWMLVVWPFLVVMAVAIYNIVQKTARVGWISYAIPVWGRIQKTRDLSTFCCTLGLRLRAGAAMIPALESARDAIRTWAFHIVVDRVIRRVREGDSLSSAMFYQRFFPKTLAWGVSLGEENGELPRTLDHFADLYGRELDRRFTLLPELLTPVGLLALGNIALLTALMVLGPFFQIIEIQQTLSSGRTSREAQAVGLLIAIIVANVSFLGAFQFFYLVVTTRRLKISLLVEHLSTLARNGMPIHTGLRIVARDLGGFLGSRLKRVAQGLEEGKSLGKAFEGASQTFPPLFRSMLTLGEKSGNLAGFLEEMRKTYRRLAELPFQAMYLFLYPLLLSIGVNLALAGLYAGVIPNFETILQQLKIDPSSQRIWWPRLYLANEVILVLCVTMVVFLVLGGSSIHFGTSVFRWMKGVVDRVLLALPGLGRILRDGAVQQFTLCAGLFLRSGASLPEAVKAAAEVERNGVLRRRFERVAHAVSEGTRLTAAVRVGGAAPDLIWFLETGETSGLLSEHLLLASLHYESKMRFLSRVAARAVVPIFIVLNGFVVFGTFYLIFSPIQETIRSILERRPF